MWDAAIDDYFWSGAHLAAFEGETFRALKEVELSNGVEVFSA